MGKSIDLTTGSIVEKLTKMALPIMGVSFIQMAYNMIDMIWVGRVGSNAVAAVGTAGFFPWLAMAFIMVSKLGVEIKVAQSMGQNNLKKIKSYIISSLQINIVLAFLYGLVLLIFNRQLIGFFNLGNQEVIEMARTYLIVVGAGMVFNFITPVFTSIFNGIGDSKTPFIINTIGLVFNMIFDPVLIFGLLGFPAMGVLGAALATVAAQAVVAICFVYVMLKDKRDYLTLQIWHKPEWHIIKEIGYIGLPAAVQSGLFTIFSMVIGRIIAIWGPVPIAVQKVGSQIEAISWMTAGGFSTALGAYVGQNYGAGKFDRIDKGIKITMMIASVLGVFSTVLLMVWGEAIFALFLPEAEAISLGKDYLIILGFSQIFMCMEITITGAFNGLGRTYLPAVLSIILTGARIPLSYILSQPQFLGLDGIWWTISATSIIKGVILVGVYIYLKGYKKLYKDDLVHTNA